MFAAYAFAPMIIHSKLSTTGSPWHLDKLGLDALRSSVATNGYREALTQGVINTRMGGKAIRVYSVAKTIADCLKYRRKLDTQLLFKAVDAGLRQTKCRRERLLHFARICRVERVLRAVANGSSRI